MLNAIPDTRSGLDFVGGYLTPNDIIGGDHADEVEERDKQSLHEAIDLGERRRSSIYSGRTDSSSSVEVPKRNSTVDAGKKKYSNIFVRLTYKTSINLSVCQKFITDVINKIKDIAGKYFVLRSRFSKQ